MKKAIFASILVVVFAFALITPTFSWFYPGPTPTDDEMYNGYGPVTPNMLITPWGSQESEYLAYKACDIDFMDWSFLASQVDELNTLDPNMDTYARAFFLDRGMREFDLNLKMYPTDDIWFRKALAHMFDKPAFVATQLAGLAIQMDSPMAWSPEWYNPYCTNLYPYGVQTAVDTLIAHGYYDYDDDGVVEGPGNVDFTILFYARQDDPDRTAMGQILANTMSVGLLSANWAASGHGACAISVDLHVAPKTECFQKVMVEFDFNIYTGGWSFGRDPDTLYFLFLGAYAQAFEYTPNYNGYQSPAFDDAATIMLTAADVPTAQAAVWDMQQILMDDVGVIPVFTYASYGGYKTGWEKVVNSIGTGPWSYFTFLNTYKTGDDTIDWGFMNDIEELNPIHSEWVWDWNVMGLIYDSLINVDPYDMTHDLPWLATSWTLGEWTFGGDTCTYVEFKLREDVYWQDILPNPTRETPGGAPLLQAGAFNVPFTAADVIFSIYCVRDIADSWNNALVSDVVYAEAFDPYTVRVYFDLFMPLWAMHWVGGLPIVPKHVWEPVYLEDHTREFDPVAQECSIGTGPWIFDYAGSVPTEYYHLAANTRFFYYHPIDMYATLDDYKILDRGTEHTIEFWLHNLDFQRTIAPSTFTVEITFNGTVIYTGSNPSLPPCVPTKIFEYTFTPTKGFYTVHMSITPDPLTGHADPDGYNMYVWATAKGDVNLDFFVNAKDAVALGVAFGSDPSDPNWNSVCDINHDHFVNAKDAVLLGNNFGLL
jgi:peptide/nickel transport system substrate-binding protein